MKNVLYCQNIEIKYKYKSLLNGINFSINSLEKKSIIGPNGCGKTSFLKVLAGILKPTRGEVFCYGEEIWPHHNLEKEQKCLYLSSQPAFFLELSVLMNLEFYCRSFSVCTSQQEMQQALEKVGLWEKRDLEAQCLSTGQMRRFTLAALCLIRPKILLADEPTNGLDEAGQKLCMQIFDELLFENKSAIVVATHDKLLSQWCDEQIYLSLFQPILQNKHIKVQEFI
jgi:heme ABC exporter ATP-binding subunit CcmA